MARADDTFDLFKPFLSGDWIFRGDNTRNKLGALRTTWVIYTF